MSEKYGFGEHDGNMPSTPDRQDIICPFCGEGEFDLPGLKFHYERGHCDVYAQTIDIPHVNSIFHLKSEGV